MTPKTTNRQCEIAERWTRGNQNQWCQSQIRPRLDDLPVQADSWTESIRTEGGASRVGRQIQRLIPQVGLGLDHPQSETTARAERIQYWLLPAPGKFVVPVERVTIFSRSLVVIIFLIIIIPFARQHLGTQNVSFFGLQSRLTLPYNIIWYKTTYKSITNTVYVWLRTVHSTVPVPYCIQNLKKI